MSLEHKLKETQEKLEYTEYLLRKTQNELESIVNIIRFIHNDNKKNNTFNSLLEKLIKLKYKTNDIFTLKEIYINFEDILKLNYPNNNTIKSSIRFNLQVLRDKKIIDFIDNHGKYILIK